MCIHHILVVDDEPVLADACKQYFEHFGYKVTVAYDGQTALDLYERHSVDALITDFRMPRMNGQELLTRIRQRKPTLPAIMVSGFPGDFRQSEDERTKVFAKPTRLHTLAQCIKNLPCDSAVN
ncbi:response regulator [Oxalobacteraceae bacterium R-40]|uniref:Response regulator n=1 Tax=Keguizhuia sedimenti TaxID=3064264 RepID=A0ABU1BJH0_9BURK|nr:response regulator [Oxalobacteraceae bacterium R-40]